MCWWGFWASFHRSLSGQCLGPLVPFAGLLLALFAVNWLHSLAHILIGAGGLATFRNPAAARTYALVIGIVYALLFVVGLIWGIRFLGGLLPLNGLDQVLHLVTALIAFGAYYASREAPATSTSV